MNRLHGTRTIITLLGCIGICTAASGADAVFQALDSVKTYSTTSVLDMAFDDPRRVADFVDSGISGEDFTACQLTAIDGLYCLDGKKVWQWPNTEDPLTSVLAIDCEDPELNLDKKKADTCTGMTVDLTGTVWLAGKNKGKTHSLIEALPVAISDSCPSRFERLQLTDGYCVKEAATGRPLLVDITPIDGDFAALFPLGPGILGLEQRKTAVFFDENGDATELASGKRDWNLVGNEQLTGITAVQFITGVDTANNYVLVATTRGRILAKQVDSSASAVAVFDIAGMRETGSTQCDFDDAIYGIRASTKSGLIYVTDRQYCEVIALTAEADEFGNLEPPLLNATEQVFIDGMPTIPATYRNLTLSTPDGPTDLPPEGSTIAPGISIDLNDCTGFCPLVIDINGDVAASLADVQLASQKSGMTLFQVKNIPDCRYDPLTCQTLLGITDLVAADVILDDPDGVGLPQAQLLNLTKLLPKEITDLFLDEGGLPDMYLARQYRGQKDNGFTFEAFFGVVEDGVIFRDTFVGEFNVQALAGTELGCRLGLPDFSPLYTENGKFGTLNWDVVNTVSETYVSLVDALNPATPDRVSTLTNADCGSSRSRDVRWSIKPYNLEITPCTYNNVAGDVWASDGICSLGVDEEPDDAVLAKLLLALFDELGASLNNLACADADDAGAPPLSGASCATLNADWLNAKDKLDKCWDAMQQPKQSSGNQNCQAFVSQLNNFESALNSAAIFGPDPANRVGELKARIFVIRHLYEERVVPSIPDMGFME